MLLPVIISGGSGERLWPVSRASFPKPFITLSDGQSLLQKSFLRACGLDGVSEILTITNSDYYYKTQIDYNKVVQSKIITSFILEPEARNTAPAIAIAAQYAVNIYGNDITLLILPADQLIEDQMAFCEAIERAKKLAEKNYLVTLGISPSRAETGFGYIELSETINDVDNTYLVKKFTEKPDMATASSYIASKNHLWNAGILCFKPQAFLDELEKHANDIFTTTTKIANTWNSTLIAHGLVELDRELFAKVPNISIDYAVMEKSSNVAVCTCDMGWNDVGSWNSISDLMEPDNESNRLSGDVYAYETNNCLIQSNKRLIAALGLQNLLVIDTPDALLVANREYAQEIKQMASKLKLDGHPAAKEHKTVFRPWGHYTIIEEGEGFKIKRIEVLPLKSISLQKHEHRSEHWVVISGIAKVQNGDEFSELMPSQSTYIKAGQKHRLSNENDTVLVLIEIQCGHYLGEDDIVRYDYVNKSVNIT